MKSFATAARITLAASTIAVLAGSATAADLRARAPAPYQPPPPPPVFYSWTGCYVGGHVGGLWARKEWFVHQVGDPNFGASEGTHDPSGVLGGVQAGCDYQFGGGFVVGVAGDYAWTDAQSSNLSLVFPTFTNRSKVNSLSSVTGRLGYAWDRFLGYVKGGGAWERDEFDFTDGVVIGSASGTRSGWTVGVGGEYAFTNFLSGFVEYNYYDFGDRDITFLQNTGVPFTEGIKETKSVVKAGLNLRFGGWGGPTRY
jgi:outer membrane immunogenic protein